MTAGADRLGWTKTAADVTPFAGYVRMRAVEHKTGTEMIECLLCPGVVRGKQRYRNAGHEQHAPEQDSGVCGRAGIARHRVHCNDLTSLNESALWQRPQSAPNSPS